MENSKDFPLGLPRSVRSGSLLYSGPTTTLPLPCVPGSSSYPSARTVKLVNKAARATDRKHQLQHETTFDFDTMAIVLNEVGWLPSGNSLHALLYAVFTR